MLPIEPIFSMFMSELVFFLDFLIWVLSVAVRLVCLQTPSAYLAPVSSVYTDIIGGMLTVSKFVSTHNTTLYQERLIIVLGTHAVPGLAGLYLHRYLLSLLRVFTELFAYNSSYESSYARLIKFSKDSLGLRLFLCCGAGGLEVSISTLTGTMSVINTQWTLCVSVPRVYPLLYLVLYSLRQLPVDGLGHVVVTAVHLHTWTPL